MSHIRKRTLANGETRWQARASTYAGGGRKYVARNFASEREALAWAREQGALIERRGISSGKDSVLYLATVWKESEFNVVGNAGGSRANFNSGSSVTVKIALTDGSTAAPSCVAGAGSTGETNNLNLGPCTPASGTNPSVQFTESN